jgi:UDP-glucuronate decarboxylase
MSNPVDVVRSALTGDEAVAVTGATGWLGSAATDLLISAIGPRWADQLRLYASSARETTTPAGVAIQVAELPDLIDQEPAPTHVVHLAYLTRDKAHRMPLADYVLANLKVTATVVAAVEQFRPRGIVAASSGAVREHGGTLATDLQGNPYGALKHLDELMITAACDTAGTACVIPRIFSVAGPGMTDVTRYALGDIVVSAMRGGPIVVRSGGDVVRSYAAVEDVVAVSLALALSGRSETFDTAGTEIEVGDLATLVAKVRGLGAESVLRTRDDTPTDRYVGEPEPWRALLADTGLVAEPLESVVRRTADWIGRTVQHRTARVDHPGATHDRGDGR